MRKTARKQRGGGRGLGMGHSARHRHDQDIFHELLDRHAAIERRVEKIPGGIRSETRSQDPRVVALLHDHVPSMHERLQENLPLRRWDPLYVELFRRRERIRMRIELLEDGVRVEEVSDDPRTAALIQAHGDAVSAFVARGHEAAARPSPLPAPGDEDLRIAGQR